MSTIRILPDRVANQIAAGEVIERPAAVVKELVENSLDAGATRIEVEFRHGGKSYIRVEDDGKGMDSADAVMCLESHATSKISEANDLMSIESFGFRGEALPSISSVSRFTLKTRREEDEWGTEILVNGGKFVHKKECGKAPGTLIEVAHLFNSVPARRKFLKTDNTESAHIVQLVRLFAMAHRDTAFILKDNGRIIFRSPGTKDLKERLSEVWSKSVAKDVIGLSDYSENNMRVYGLLGKPGQGRSNRQDMQCFVNGRPVDSRTMGYALIESYHTFLPKGRYPAAFLFLEISSAAVDVNVHPSKREVRFRDEGAVRRLIINAVTVALKKLTSEIVPERNSSLETANNATPVSRNVEVTQVSESKVSEESPAKIGSVPKINKSVPEVKKSEIKSNDSSLTKKIESSPKESESKTETKSIKIDWRYIGLIKSPRLIAIFETTAGVVMMNCRSAHERVSYEKILKEFEEGDASSQALLLPIPLELDPLTSSVLERYQEYIESQGVVLREFGRNFYRIEALPAWLSEKDGETFVKDLISFLREHDAELSGRRLIHEKLAAFAAGRAVRVGDNPSESEVRHLLEKLMICENPLVCPSGKKTYIEIPANELDKKFGVFASQQKTEHWI